MKWFYGVLILLCPYVGYTQGNSISSKVVGVGEKVPVLQLDKIYNSAVKSRQLKPAKNKLIVLDFLATYCSSCIEFTPKWQKLKQRFGDSLEVVLVSDEEKERLEKFANKRPGFFGQLPILYENKDLKEYFPFEYISHLVWINGEGKVAAITGTSYVTEKNISSVLHGAMPGWPVKRDITHFNTSLPLVIINDNNIPYNSLPTVSMYSAFTAHMPDLPRGYYQKVDSIANSRKISFINVPLFNIYRKLLGGERLPVTRLLVEGGDRDDYVMDAARHLKAGWELSNTFSYELTVPTYMSEQKRQNKILDDLLFYTGTQAVLKDTLMACLVLKDTLGVNAVRLKQEAVKDSIRIRNIVYQLNRQTSGLPALVETQGRSEEMIPYEPNLFDNLPRLNTWLLPYGLVVRPALRKIQVLVLTEETPNPFITHPKLYLK